LGVNICETFILQPVSLMYKDSSRLPYFLPSLFLTGLRMLHSPAVGFNIMLCWNSLSVDYTGSGCKAMVVCCGFVVP